MVVMISGHASIETAVRATKLGAFDFIEKPLSLEATTLAVQQGRRLPAPRRGKPPPARGTRRALPRHRRERPDEGPAPADRPGRAHQRPRADLRRKRHRQGTGRARPARRQPAQRRAVRRGELRRHPRRADRMRAVRPRQGQLHRRLRKQGRQVPEGRRRHAFPRRSRRHEPAHPGQGSARARRAAHRAGRLQPGRHGQRARPGRHQQETRRDRSRARCFARTFSTA